jgi:polysaccharide pyruvyl transferase WcaK-like protein
VTKSLIESILDYKVKLVHSVGLRDDWERPGNLTFLLMADLIIINGEGTIHHNSLNGDRLADAVEYFKNIGKKVAILNSVFEANNEVLYSKIGKADWIFVRETLSKIELDRYEIKSKVVPDLVFNQIDIFQKYETRKNKKKIIVNDSVVASYSEEILRLSKKIDKSYRIKLRITYLENLEIKRIKSNFLKRTIRLILDVSPRRLLSMLKSNPRILNKQNFTILEMPDLVGKISNSDFIITGRFHMVCFAIMNEIPFLALPSNTHKTFGMLKDIGLESRYFEKIPKFDVLESLYNYDDNEIALIIKYKILAKKEIQNMFDTIFEEAR